MEALAGLEVVEDGLFGVLFGVEFLDGGAGSFEVAEGGFVFLGVELGG